MDDGMALWQKEAKVLICKCHLPSIWSMCIFLCNLAHSIFGSVDAKVTTSSLKNRVKYLSPLLAWTFLKFGKSLISTNPINKYSQSIGFLILYHLLSSLDAFNSMRLLLNFGKLPMLRRRALFYDMLFDGIQWHSPSKWILPGRHTRSRCLDSSDAGF